MAQSADLRPAAAVEELAADPASRKRFLRMAGAGAAGALAVAIAACGGGDDESSSQPATARRGPVPSPKQDLEIVNYALTLEYLESDFYARVISGGFFSGPDLELVRVIADHERQHVEALTAAARRLDGRPARRPRTRFDVSSRQEALELAISFEDLGAAAYLGQANRIQSKEVLASALAIHTVEARHAAALNEIGGKSPTPDGAFAKPMDMNAVLAKAKPFIVA